jgi:hypothetical protein
MTATIIAAARNSKGAKLEDNPGLAAATGAPEGTTDGVEVGMGSGVAVEAGVGSTVGVGSAEGRAVGVAVDAGTPSVVDGTGKEDPGLLETKYCPPDDVGELLGEAEGGKTTPVGLADGVGVIDSVFVGSAEGCG